MKLVVSLTPRRKNTVRVIMYSKIKISMFLVVITDTFTNPLGMLKVKPNIILPSLYLIAISILCLINLSAYVSTQN